MNITKKQKCVMCGKNVVYRYRPFCSEHCKNIDLLNWVKGHYAIPAEKEDEKRGEQTQGEEQEDS